MVSQARSPYGTGHHDTANRAHSTLLQPSTSATQRAEPRQPPQPPIDQTLHMLNYTYTWTNTCFHLPSCSRWFSLLYTLTPHPIFPEKKKESRYFQIFNSHPQAERQPQITLTHMHINSHYATPSQELINRKHHETHHRAMSQLRETLSLVQSSGEKPHRQGKNEYGSFQDDHKCRLLEGQWQPPEVPGMKAAHQLCTIACKSRWELLVNAA